MGKAKLVLKPCDFQKTNWRKSIPGRSLEESSFAGTKVKLEGFKEILESYKSVKQNIVYISVA